MKHFTNKTQCPANDAGGESYGKCPLSHGVPSIASGGASHGKMIRNAFRWVLAAAALGTISAGASEDKAEGGNYFTRNYEALGPQPLIHNLTTGYLLQCSFLSPRPYCWPKKETVKLSGWEVDKSGGDFEYKPTGGIGVDFRFHSEWIKLVDTSTTAAVTLKHQVARQTEGTLTLEFRFRLPAAMDGACWQLRDLEQAGVSLFT